MKKLLLFIALLGASSILQAQNYLCFTANVDNSSVGMMSMSDNDTFPELNVDVNFSFDGVTWDVVPANTPLALKKGEKVFIKGENPEGFSTEDRWNQFFMTGSISASGSVMSLIDGEGLATQIPASDCFSRLFKECESLVEAPELTATQLDRWCYYEMFYKCTGLTAAPELPAAKITNGCYSSMFSQCSNLTEAPALPATQLGNDCYASMFSSCTSLKKAPSLPATVLAGNCYYNMFGNCSSLTEFPSMSATKMATHSCTFMFSQCTSLAKVPEILPAMQLAEACYRGMFSGCSSLTVAPELPATELADYCYWEMFSGCSSLEKAPYLPATELKIWSYYQMFQFCSNLNYVEMILPSWDLAGNDTYAWLKDVASTGTFVCQRSLEVKYGESYIPEGWKVVRAYPRGVEKVYSMDNLFTDDGHIFVVASQKGVANIFNLAGQSVKSVSFESGETDLGAFPTGIYVVNGRKVVVE